MDQQVVVVPPPAPNFCPCQEDTLNTTPRSPYTVTIEETHVQNPLVLKHKTPSDDGTSIPTISTTTRLSLVMEESKSIANISIPMILTGLLLYSRSMISMLFLGRLGDLALAGGALAVGFANITGYSILSGLAMGMEPICGQAFGAKKLNLLGLTLQRTILLLLLTSVPISFLWLNMKRILLICGQDLEILSQAQLYLVCSIPDLLAQSFLHPLRIYLRSQSITLPLTFCAALSILIHFPVNYILVCKLGLGIKGVALSGVLMNTALVLSLVAYIVISGAHKRTWGGFSRDCFREWAVLLGLAIPSCVSVCLEWWWYEFMILLCGLLLNPRATVASMGVLIQTTSLIYIFPSSLSFGVSTRVGNELGARNSERARLAAKVGMGWSVAMGVAALGFAVAVREGWAGLFTGDEEIGRMTAAVLPILGLCELGNCPQTTGCGVLRGTARPKVGANVNLGCFYLVGAPIAVWLAFFLGFDFKGLWLGLLAAQLSCLVSMVVVLGRTDWAREAHRAQLLTWGGASDSVGEGVGKGAYDDVEEEEEKALMVKILVDGVPRDFSIDV